ncbi:Uu.00g007370.m01.CDS01 [Anthostomella pinea]|uniref:Uu.00g007370.m01.CDS01 n=1 Tax=Anthostomella pinea TaxID=933095 RepID=A0AAI8YPS2_9PEZI|nr:Uu.00g007370.m01.CDS01 [Anthostomella pinea]
MDGVSSQAEPAAAAAAPAPAIQPPTAGPPVPSAPSPGRSSVASPVPSTPGSTGRMPYVPQFTAATQMILQRINSQPGSLSAALSSASSVASTIERSTFEDAKRRLVMTMNTSMTMPMPPPKPVSSAHGSSTIRVGDAFQLRTPAPPKPATTAKGSSKGPAQKPKAKAVRIQKRKRGKDDDDGESSSLSDLSDSDVEHKDQLAVPTMTKSGRQVQKPTQYNPASMAGSSSQQQKRKNWGKRTPEQALCKVCTRGLSPVSNQIVFCDGCNLCWHQLCHDPYIDDDFVSDEGRSWFCGRCAAKREKHLAKKKTMDGFKGVSWAGKSVEQKRAYLSNITPAQLVNIIMYSTELHPDLPVFPAHEPGPGARRGPQNTPLGLAADSLFLPTSTNLSGPAHYVRKSSTADRTPTHGNHHTGTGKGGASVKAAFSAETQNQAAREGSADSVPPAWPKVGQGCLAGVDLKEDDLEDKNDYEAFSVMTYDSKGNKVLENGMPV